MPRFQGENAEHNARLVAALREIASGQGVTVAQLAIAWVASRGEDIIPLLGARRRAQLEEGLQGVELARRLSDDDLRALEQAAPAAAVHGDRYGAPQMADLDSER